MIIGCSTAQQNAKTFLLYRGMESSYGRITQSSESLGKVVGFQDNLAGTFAGAKKRPKFSMLAGVVTWQQANVSSTPNGFRNFGLQVRFQLRRIVPVGLRDTYD